MEKNRMDFAYSSIPIITINNKINREFNLTPEFQRGYIWSNEFKDELIISILRNYPIGNIILFDAGKGMKIVVDGQQRLRTITNFMAEENKEVKYKINNAKSVRIIKDILKERLEKYADPKLNIDKQKIDDLKSIAFEDLPKLIQDDFRSYNLNVTTLLNASSETVAKYFKFVQNHEQLRAGEIIKSLYTYVAELNNIRVDSDVKETILKTLNFSEKRNEFDKTLINMLGVLNGKIPLNAPNRFIIEYAENFSGELNQNSKFLLDNLNSLAKIIIELNEENIFKHKGNIRAIKLFLIFLSFEKEVSVASVSRLYQILNFIERNKNDEKIKAEITFIEVRSRSFKDLGLCFQNMKKLESENLDL